MLKTLITQIKRLAYTFYTYPVEIFKIVIASAPTNLPAPKSTNLGKFKYITVKSRSKEQ